MRQPNKLRVKPIKVKLNNMCIMRENMKKALITGITGQDGAYLAKFLLDKGYEVFGTYRRSSTPNFWRLKYLNIFEKIKLVPLDLIDSPSINQALDIIEPEEIYHLAAQSYVGASFEQPIATGMVTGIGTTQLLEATVNLLKKHKDIKFYNAATSELYGNNLSGQRNELSSFNPRSPYAAAKLYSFWVTSIYREAYRFPAFNGILFNHESPLRGLEFVTRKITNAVARISLGLQEKIVIGNVKARRDWGYAGDYVEAMWKMLQNESSNDYVIATGESHSVKEFLELAFEIAGVSSLGKVEVSKKLYRPLEVNDLKGDYSKAKNELSWSPKVGFDDLVKMMVKKDIERWELALKSEIQFWDAPSYTDEDSVIKMRYSLDR